MLADQLHHLCFSGGNALDQHWKSYCSYQGKSRKFPSAWGTQAFYFTICLATVFCCVYLCVCQKLLTLLACTLQSLIKTLAVPFVDQCSFDRPGWIFRSRNRILSEKRPSSSAFIALVILIESEHKHIRLSSLLLLLFFHFRSYRRWQVSFTAFFKNKQGHFKSITEQEGGKNGLTSLSGCALPFGVSGLFSLCWVKVFVSSWHV